MPSARDQPCSHAFIRPGNRATVLMWVVVGLLGLASWSRADSLQAALDEALQPTGTNPAKVGAVVLDGLTGETLYASADARESLIPASNMKLLTTATTLDLYGPHAVLTTTLAVAGDDLLVIGTGDPAFGDPELAARYGRTPMSILDDWAAALRATGVVRIVGDVIVVDGVFDEQLVHPTWSTGNRRQWYGAPVAGVNFNNNCVDFHFIPTAPGQAATIQTVPPSPSGGFIVRGKVTSRGKDGGHNPVLDKQVEPEADGRTVFLVRGGVTQAAGPFSKPVDDPRKFMGEALRGALAAHGITVAGTVRVERELCSQVAQRARVIATHESRLPDILGRVNADSQNMMAEALAKLNGWAFAQRRGETDTRGSWAGGHAAAIAFLQRLGIDTLPVVATDGSGLSRQDRVSAAVLARLLDHMLREHPHGGFYLDSLAINGVRGSLRHRMKEMPGRVFAKTGTINGVSALSGYVFAENGRVAAFSILHNGPGGTAAFRLQQDAAVRAIAAWMNQQSAVPIDAPEVREAMERVGLLAGAD